MNELTRHQLIQHTTSHFFGDADASLSLSKTWIQYSVLVSQKFSVSYPPQIKFRCFHLCSFATQKVETSTRKYSGTINRTELYQSDWMGHPLQSLTAIFKHPSWRLRSNRMATHILTEVQGPSAAQHFQWAIQSWLRNYPKLNDWEVGPTAHKCPCFSLKKSCQPSPVLHLGFLQRLLCKRNPRSPHRWHSDLEISIWKIFLERQITVTGSDKKIFFFMLPLKIKRGKAIVRMLMLHRGFCNLPQHAKVGK